MACKNNSFITVHLATLEIDTKTCTVRCLLVIWVDLFPHTDQYQNSQRSYNSLLDSNHLDFYHYFSLFYGSTSCSYRISVSIVQIVLTTVLINVTLYFTILVSVYLCKYIKKITE